MSAPIQPDQLFGLWDPDARRWFSDSFGRLSMRPILAFYTSTMANDYKLSNRHNSLVVAPLAPAPSQLDLATATIEGLMEDHPFFERDEDDDDDDDDPEEIECPAPVPTDQPFLAFERRGEEER